jgi:D-serine deaminase-like pyridoxal phosphate-dependent protein
MKVEQLDTPALIVDLDIMDRNLRRAADYALVHGLRLHPHTKTHKIPELGKRQLGLGAAGLTVAKVSEGEVMMRADPHSLLVAYPVLGDRKLERLARLAQNAEITVAVDSEVAVQQLAQAAEFYETPIQVYIEIDMGLGRMGVSSVDDAVALGKIVARHRSIELVGLTFYPGHVKQTREAEEQTILLSQRLHRFLQGFSMAGLPVRIVSGGSTPLLYHSHLVEGLNEIRPGTYIFNDRNTVMGGACGWADCAASILATVVSTAKPGQVIIDGGSKTFSSDRLSTGDDAYFGRVVGYDLARFHKMNEEHGFVEIADHALQVGDRLRVIPNHVCVAVNLHEYVYGIRGDEVIEMWRVEGRGKLQ